MNTPPLFSTPPQSEPSDYDNPWKGALEVFFQPFLQLLFPQVACRVDWQVAPEFLDKELLQIVSEAELGRRTADKLVKLRFLDGTEQWVLVHVEVQDSPQPEFAERMFVYYYRIRDRYQKPVISLAVLTDTRRSYRPNHYHTELAGCSLRFDFITAKLLDWQERQSELLATPNPFGLLVAAQLTAKLVHDGRQRADNLMAFYRLAIEKNVKKEHIRELVNFLEWIVGLLKSAQPYYEELTRKHTEDNTMSYVSLIERWGIEKGLEQGIEQGIERGLEVGRSSTLQKLIRLKFGAIARHWQARLESANSEQLDLWTERILFADSIEAVFAEE